MTAQSYFVYVQAIFVPESFCTYTITKAIFNSINYLQFDYLLDGNLFVFQNLKCPLKFISGGHLFPFCSTIHDVPVYFTISLLYFKSETYTIFFSVDLHGFLFNVQHEFTCDFNIIESHFTCLAFLNLFNLDEHFILFYDS